MNYKRTYVNNIFADIIPNGKLYMAPDLPKIEFKRDKIKYKITDIRLLNETAVNTFLKIMEIAMNTKNCEEVSFDITGVEEDRWDLIWDIAGNIQFEASKGGKNGFRFDGRFLTGAGSICTKEDNTKIVTISLRKDHAKYLYEYARDKETVDFIDAIIYVINRDHEETWKQILESRGKGWIK